MFLAYPQPGKMNTSDLSHCIDDLTFLLESYRAPPTHQRHLAPVVRTSYALCIFHAQGKGEITWDYAVNVHDNKRAAILRKKIPRDFPVLTNQDDVSSRNDKNVSLWIQGQAHFCRISFNFLGHTFSPEKRAP